MIYQNLRNFLVKCFNKFAKIWETLGPEFCYVLALNFDKFHKILAENGNKFPIKWTQCN